MTYLYSEGNNPCSGIIQQPGYSVTLNAQDADTASVSFKTKRGEGINHSSAPNLGDKHPCHGDMYVVGVNVQMSGDFDTISVSYEGFLNGNKVKIPSGGAGQATSEASIELHPNYKTNKYSWGTIIGEGNASPNEFGRVLDDDGRFKHFGPLPDGKDGRPEPAEKNTDCIKTVTDLCRLEGVESFLEVGQISYSYEIVTGDNWAKKHTRNICKICKPSSRLIPVPTLPSRKKDEKRNWLLKDLQIDQKSIGSNAEIVTTRFEFLSSGSGGWNALIYEEGEGIDLDGESSARSAFRGIQ